MENKDIDTKNAKDERHGYQEWYDRKFIWYRGCYKNNEEVGYNEINYNILSGIGQEGTEVNFYIK